MKAVERAGAIAGENATLVIACAYFPTRGRDIEAVSDVLRTRPTRSTAPPPPRRSCAPPRSAHRMRAPN